MALIMLGLQATRQLHEDVADLDHARGLQLQTQRIVATLLAVESRQRAYLLTADAAERESDRASLGRLERELDELVGTLAALPGAAPDLRRLREQFDARRAEWARTIALADQRGAGAAWMVAREGRSSARLDDVPAVLSRLDALAHAALAERRAARAAIVDRNERLAILIAILLGLIALALPALNWRARTHEARRTQETARVLEAMAHSLAVSEARLRGICDASIDAILTLNDAQVIVAANPAAARMFRCSVPDLLHLPLDHLIPAGGAALRPMGSGRREVRGLRLDGEAFPLDACLSRFEHAGQHLCTAMLRDLTSLRRLEATLRDSERLMSETFRASSVAMLQIDPATRRFVAVNEALCRLSGYAAFELLGMTPDRLNHPDDGAGRATPGALLCRESAQREEVRLVRKDGTVVWTEISGGALRDTDGAAVPVVWVIQDITERMRAYDELCAREARQAFLVRLNGTLWELEDPQVIFPTASRLLVEFLGTEHAGFDEADEVSLMEDVAQRARTHVARTRARAEAGRTMAQLQAALASMNDAVFISDADGRFIEFNDAFVSFYRFRDRQECLATLTEYPEILEVFLPDGTPVPLDQWATSRALRGESGSSVEYQLQRKDTGEAWTGSYSFAPIRAGDGSIAGAVVNGRDITQIRQTHADLVAAHAVLRGLMADQQRVQEDERKRIARELHDDLQQSLAAIRLDAVDVGNRVANRRYDIGALLSRIDQLSSAAIASTRRIVSDLRPEMLEELGLVLALEALCTQHAQRNGFDCRLEASPAALAVQLDRPVLSIGLYRIAQEALNNVVKHARASEVKVQLDAIPQRGVVLLRVSDNGVGIAWASERHPGSFGLIGMAERVRALGGQMRIDTRPMQGTTIEASVPVLTPEGTRGQETVRASRAPGVEQQQSPWQLI